MTTVDANPIPAVDELLVDSARRLFADTSTFDTVQAAEADGWSEPVWNAVAEAGFAWIGLPVEAGGSGGSLTDICEVVRIGASFAAPVPLAENALLGGWLLTRGGLELPEGSVTVIPGTADDSLTVQTESDGLVISGTVHRVPWAARSELITTVVRGGDGQSHVVAIPPSAVGIDTMRNVAGEPRETVHFDRVQPQLVGAVPADTADELRLRGALARTMQMAGALEAMSALTVDYTEQRQQFGRPVSRFQAVQQHLVWAAQDAAITKMAAQMAVHAADGDDGVLGARFQVASARTIAEGSSSTATRWAHQAHGAMGMTQEYALHHLSRRLWAWRHEFATPGEWAAAVGHLAMDAGADGHFPLITS